MCDKVFVITSGSQYDGYQRELASIVYKFFDQKSNDTTTHTGTGTVTDYQQLFNKSHNPS